MIDQIFLELPYPISTNRYWRIFRGDSVVSADAKAYKNTIKNIAAEKNIVPFNGNVSLQIIIYPKRNKDGSANAKVLDLDNCLKVVLDALQGVAYDNDKQIKRINVRYGQEPKDGGAVGVMIEAF